MDFDNKKEEEKKQTIEKSKQKQSEIKRILVIMKLFNMINFSFKF